MIIIICKILFVCFNGQLWGEMMPALLKFLMLFWERPSAVSTSPSMVWPMSKHPFMIGELIEIHFQLWINEGSSWALFFFFLLLHSPVQTSSSMFYRWSANLSTIYSHWPECTTTLSLCLMKEIQMCGLGRLKLSVSYWPPLTYTWSIMCNCSVLFKARWVICWGAIVEFQKQNECAGSFFSCSVTLEGRVKSFLTHGDPDRAIHAFINSQLDYCSALGGNLFLLSWFPLVQNAVAHNTFRMF